MQPQSFCRHRSPHSKIGEKDFTNHYFDKKLKYQGVPKGFEQFYEAVLRSLGDLK